MAKKEFLILVLLLSVFFVQYAVAESGCCLNPMANGCSYMTIEECCPIDSSGSYVGVGEVGPVNQGNCTQSWFFPSATDDACVQMSAAMFPNAGYCTQGCCCMRPPEPVEGDNFPVEFTLEKKLLCSGLDQSWLDLTTTPLCDDMACGSVMYPPKNRNVSCEISIPNYCDPFPSTLPKTQCKNVTTVDSLNADPETCCAINTMRGVCCNDGECAAEIVGEEETKDICIANLVAPFDNPMMVCVNGRWLQTGLPVGAGELCAKETGRTAEDAPITEQVGTCQDSLLCKPAMVDDLFYTCCGQTECGFYNTTSENGTCYADGIKVEFGNETKANFTCDNGTWASDNLSAKKPHGESCNKSIDCETGLACLPYNIGVNELTPEAGIKHCCLKDGTECGSESGCAAPDDERNVGNDTYLCIGPLWAKKTPAPITPRNPSGGGGGGCGGGGGGSGIGTSGADRATNDTDGDGITDDADNCINVSNADQADFDVDGIGDSCDTDTDGDGITNDADNCLNVSNADQADLDGDGIGDLCDNDKDGDTFLNDADNCPDKINLDQLDDDNDKIGDVCDPTNDENNTIWTWGIILTVAAAGVALFAFAAGWWTLIPVGVVLVLTWLATVLF